MIDRRKDALEIVRELRATPERVFKALTDPQDLMSWWGGEGKLTGAHVNLRPGGEYRLEFLLPDGQTGWVKGQYQVVEPPRRVVKTWFSSSHPDLRNTVEFRLEPAPGGTRLTLVHSGLADRPDAYGEYEKGWAKVLGHLVAWAVASERTGSA
jgi:uncharacterized protein YndB with AHSA1/START domain